VAVRLLVQSSSDTIMIVLANMHVLKSCQGPMARLAMGDRPVTTMINIIVTTTGYIGTLSFDARYVAAWVDSGAFVEVRRPR